MAGVKNRKVSEQRAYTKEMEEMINQPLRPPSTSEAPGDLKQELDYINSNRALHAEYHISSHRGILGRPPLWGRQLVRGEVRRYVDLIAGCSRSSD
ncbi:MAG: hypothetical protein J5U17_12290 [Candidatus Methanoperedens sp.]|nr:hypothetical protein [Candidatus Methanoperedens sp.]MCE8426541.1 hypothetical protein [Candidatus Methanoperedens sp.]